MVNKRIEIYMKATDGALSYIETYDALSRGDCIIKTSSLDFFSFDYILDYDCIVYNGEGGYISARELLKNDRYHTKKNIREAHNIRKMLIAGSFKFKPIEGYKDYSPYISAKKFIDLILDHQIEISWEDGIPSVYAEGMESGLYLVDNPKQDFISAIEKSAKENERFKETIKVFDNLFGNGGDYSSISHLNESDQELVFQAFLAGRKYAI